MSDNTLISIRELKSMNDTIQIESFDEFTKIKNIVVDMAKSDESLTNFINQHDFPITKGFLCIKGYGIASEFKYENNTIKVKTYISADAYTNDKFDDSLFLEFFSADLDCINNKMINKKPISRNNTTSNFKMALSLEEKDDTCRKQLHILVSVLYFIAKYQPEPIEVTTTMSKSERKKTERKNGFRKVPLVTKRYILNSTSHGKHVITCPSWSVRGHYRHLKSGKVIWIEPCVKGKERDKIAPAKKVYSGI